MIFESIIFSACPVLHKYPKSNRRFPRKNNSQISHGKPAFFTVFQAFLIGDAESAAMPDNGSALITAHGIRSAQEMISGMGRLLIQSRIYSASSKCSL